MGKYVTEPNMRGSIHLDQLTKVCASRSSRMGILTFQTFQSGIKITLFFDGRSFLLRFFQLVFQFLSRFLFCLFGERIFSSYSQFLTVVSQTEIFSCFASNSVKCFTLEPEYFVLYKSMIRCLVFASKAQESFRPLFL